MAILFATVAYGAEVRIRLENTYVAIIDLGPLGGGHRNGTDIVEGVLTEQADGTWSGPAKASIDMHQQLHGPFGVSCPMTHFEGKQTVTVSATKVTGWNNAQTITFNRAAGPGQRSGQFLELTVEAAEVASIAPTEPCLTMGPINRVGQELLPLNDGRWTQPKFGYAIELPESGVLVWTDETVDTIPDPAAPPPGLANATSNWKVRVERL